MNRSRRLPLCHHVKINGTRCKTPALRGERYCYFHHRTIGRGARLARLQSPLPLLEDANAVQVAIYRIILAILDGSLEPRQATAILYALQTASFNLKNTDLNPYWENVVTVDEDEEPAERPKPPQPASAPSSAEDVTDFLNKLLPAAATPDERGPHSRAPRVNVGQFLTKGRTPG